VDDFDYLPEGELAYGDTRYGNYPDATATWPGEFYADGSPAGYPPRQANGMPWRPPADEAAIRGYPPQATRYPPPATGYPPPGSGPLPRYQPGARPPRAHSGPMPAYRPDSGPMRAYRQDSGPLTAYPSDTGPMRAYRADSGPMPAYRDRGPGHRRTDTALLAGPPRASGPRPAGAPAPARPPSGHSSALDSLLSIGKRVPAWLPFGNRLVLLPKDLTLDAADGELREHRDVNGGWLRPAVFGAMDGLVTNSSLIAGIGGGGAGHAAIVLTGIAGLIAGAFSMATGEYISVKSQNELTQAEVELERKQHDRDPAGKRARLAEVYMEKGVSPNLAEAVVRQISADRDRAVAAHVREELGIDPDDLPSPRTAAVASFASFTVGALIPLSPFLAGYPVLNVALALAGASAFAGGAAVAKLTGRSALLGGLRQFTAAFLATGMAFLIGHLVGAHVG